MQGEADRQRELLDLEAVAGHLLPVGSVFVFLAEHRHRLFPASMFADLFPSARWTAACGYTINAGGFHPSTLIDWRRRLAASDRPQRIIEAVRDVVTATGAIAGKQRRALDSTVLDDPVARHDTVTQLRRVMAARARIGKGPETVQAMRSAVPPHLPRARRARERPSTLVVCKAACPS